MVLNDICVELNNWFEQERIIDNFTISDNVVVSSSGTPIAIKDNQYYRIIGSVYNDGVHQEGGSLRDEQFRGGIWLMHVPLDVIQLANDVKAYNDKYESSISPYSSESFGGYTYSRVTDSNGAIADWRTIFAKRMNKWRKLR